MSNNAYSQYRENQITSASPEETVLMLYEGAISSLGLAMKELEENKNLPEKSLLIEKTVKIIDYLDSCLDEVKGDVIARNLKDLYGYMVIELTKANLKNDVKKMEEVLGLLHTIKEGWSGIIDKKSGDKNASPAYSGASGMPEEGDQIQPKRNVVIKA
jgi:flagellar protein FliS